MFMGPEQKNLVFLGEAQKALVKYVWKKFAKLCKTLAKFSGFCYTGNSGI